jgi:long-chain acyl-CoA synthetase
MVQTLSQLFLHTVKSFPKDDFMLFKEEGVYKPLSTHEFASRVKHLSLGLRNLGFGSGDKLVILSWNRPEWIITDLACLCLGGITVPIYISLTPEQIKYIIDDSDATVVVCENQELWKKVEAVKRGLTKVTHYITFEKGAPAGVLTLSEVQEQGKRIDKENSLLFEKLATDVKPDDIATIIYTSGTTGPPKGAMLTHSNLVSNVQTCSDLFDFSDKHTVLSFLPLTHVLERFAMYAYFLNGMTIGFAESLETLAENLLEVRPHHMVNVPRALERIYSRIIDNVLTYSSLKKKIFFWAVEVGKKYGRKKILKQPIPKILQIKRNLANKLVFSKIYEKTGGRVRYFLCGGAALSRDIAEFFYSIGLTICEGYGLTETSPVISVNTLENLRFGTVGKPIPGVEVKIAADGEILTKGPNVMKGYYRKEEATQEAFEGGWFHTGDIGHFDEDGFLVITDRKKDILVTSGGKNVAPQPIEGLLKLNPFIVNAVVVGDGRKFISALIVPDFEKLEQYAKSRNIPFDSRQELIQKEEIVDFILAEVDRSTPHLASFEKIKKVALLERDFEIGEGEMTPSYKVKRNIVEKKYKPMIDSFYKE